MQKSPRKVLWVVLDQWRADTLSGALASCVRLPNISSLLKECTYFPSHYSVASPCGPARASMLTGMYALNHRSVRNGSPLANWHTNIALEARKAGVEPLLFGYTDTSADPDKHHESDPALSSYEGLLPGFNEVLEMRMESGYSWRAHLKSKGYSVPESLKGLYTPKTTSSQVKPRISDPAFYSKEHSDTAFLADEVIKGLSVREHQNWMTHVTFLRPHPPLVAPEPYNTMYRPENMPKPWRLADEKAESARHPFLKQALESLEVSDFVAGQPWVELNDTGSLAEMRAVYLGLLSEADEHVGRIVDYMKQTGQWEHTLFILTSDHGEALGDHHLWGKEHCFDQAFRTPLLIRDPYRPRGRGMTFDNHFTESIDIAPTVLEWLGRSSPDSFNGASLIPFFDGVPPQTWRDYVYSEVDYGDLETVLPIQKEFGLDLLQCNFAVLREHRFKYVHFNGGLPPLLFDMISDPQENNNLAGEPALQHELYRLASKMLSHRMRYAHSSHTRLKITPKGVARHKS